MELRNLKISTRLIGVMTLLSSVLVGIVLVAMLQMQAMRNSTQEITDNWLPSVMLAGNLKAAISNLRTLESQHVLNTDETAMERFAQTMVGTVAAIEALRQDYTKLVNTPDEQALSSALEADWKKYLTQHQELVDMSTRREKFPARKLLEGDAKLTFDSLSATVDKVIALNQQGAGAAAQTTEAHANQARTVMLIATLVALVVAAAAAVWLIRSITRPIRTVVALADQIAEGDLSQAISVDSTNETGQLLSALQRMQSQLVQVVANVRSDRE